ncbi:hypothetical protein VDG1235_749 [Verrucomicrobiia bacterium DG1235]|nr:hypothetical protein VDG1235_749 [Verrucomicrobiae bacterium DG1235]
MKAVGVSLVSLVAIWLAGCQGKDGDCRYEEVLLPAMVTQSFDKSVVLKLERDDRLVTLSRGKVEGAARVGSSYTVLVRDLVEGSCTPLVVVEAKPR